MDWKLFKNMRWDVQHYFLHGGGETLLSLFKKPASELHCQEISEKKTWNFIADFKKWQVFVYFAFIILYIDHCQFRNLELEQKTKNYSSRVLNQFTSWSKIMNRKKALETADVWEKNYVWVVKKHWTVLQKFSITRSLTHRYFFLVELYNIEM